VLKRRSKRLHHLKTARPLPDQLRDLLHERRDLLELVIWT
jgi:hypothetical protein